MEDRFIETIPPMYSGLLFYVEKSILPICCEEVSELVPFCSELKLSLQKRSEGIQELKMPWEDKTLFAPDNTFLAPRTPSARPLSQALSRDCERL